MQQWYKCPNCNGDLLWGANPCPYCKCPLNWRQKQPPLRQPPIETPQQQAGQPSTIVQPAANLTTKKRKSHSIITALRVSLLLSLGNILLQVIWSVSTGHSFWPWGTVDTYAAIALFSVSFVYLGIVKLIKIITKKAGPLPTQAQLIMMAFLVLGVIIAERTALLGHQQREAQVKTVAPPYSNPAPVVKPAPTLHNISVDEIESNPAYWNTAWQGRGAELQMVTKQINQMYLKSHTYIKGQTDCNDMTVDIWNMLQTAGIISIIVAGNLDEPGPITTLAQCNHAWLAIYGTEKGDSKPKCFFLESTNGELYFRGDIERNLKLQLYGRGFYYTKPSDLRADFKERW